MKYIRNKIRFLRDVNNETILTNDIKRIIMELGVRCSNLGFHYITDRERTVCRLSVGQKKPAGTSQHYKNKKTKYDHTSHIPPKYGTGYSSPCHKPDSPVCRQPQGEGTQAVETHL